jgi:hypothetical protein
MSTFEEVRAEHVVPEPTLHMLKATTLSATWKVIIETFRPILHILHKPLHQITPNRVVDMMLQTQRATRGRIPVRTIRIHRMPTITVDQALEEELSRQDVTRPRKIEAQEESAVRLEREPQPSLLAAYLDPRLINHEASNATNREAIVQTAEMLNPIPD